MIEPGKITIEVLLNSPYLYLIVLYGVPLLLGGLAAYFADRAADEKLKQEVKVINPQADTTQAYEFEHIRDPIAWGILAVVVVVYPMASALDEMGDWSVVWASAVLAGLASRAILMKLASSFITKVTRQ